MSVSYVSTKELPSLPPPRDTSGFIGFVKTRLFGSISNTILTLIGLVLVAFTIPAVLNYFILDAVFTGTTREACIPEVGQRQGACWPFVAAKWNQMLYGFYDAPQRWRVNLVWTIGIIGLVPLLIPKVPYKAINALFMLGIYPVFAFIMFTGGNFNLGSFLFARSAGITGNLAFWVDFLSFFMLTSAAIFIAGMVLGFNAIKTIRNVGIVFLAIALIAFFVSQNYGLRNIPTARWGGLMVTLVVASVGIVISLPLGILLALGRRSNLPILRLLCVIFIEFWRGVPLILVLFMASNLLPLFLPDGVNFDRLLRALVGVAFFASAYMAEVVRGGLQAIPKGQYEGANALGLTYWQSMQKIILPQALKMVIPGIVNTFIALFKDTTLVLIIGLFDVLGVMKAASADPNWITPTTAMTGYITAGVIFFIFCFGMSRYSMFIEESLHTGHKRR